MAAVGDLVQVRARDGARQRARAHLGQLPVAPALLHAHADNMKLLGIKDHQCL